MRQPRIELGAQRWQRWILPLNHWRKLQGMGIEPSFYGYIRSDAGNLFQRGRARARWLGLVLIVKIIE